MWFAVKEFQINYHNPETIPLTTYDGNLNEIP